MHHNRTWPLDLILLRTQRNRILPVTGGVFELKAAPNTTTSTSLTWTESSPKPDTYRIERSTDGISFSTVTSAAADVFSYTDTGRTESTQYYYRIVPVLDATDQTPSNIANTWTVPATPTGLTATAISSTQINLAWTDVSTGNTAQSIQRRSPAGSGSYSFIASVGATATAYSDTGLTAATQYEYQVAATNPATQSAWSTAANATTTGGGPPASSWTLDFSTGEPWSNGTNYVFSSTASTTRTFVNSSGYVAPCVANLLLRSEDFTTTWTNTNTTDAANTTTSPDGNTTADTITESAAISAGRDVRQTVTMTITSGASYTWSVYAKADTATVLQLTAGSGQFGTNEWANFDLANGTIGSVGTSVTGSDATITNMGSGWYRCQLTMVATGNGTSAIYLCALTDNSTTSGRLPTYTVNAGNERSLYLWGAQLVTGSAALPYSATTTSSNGIPRLTHNSSGSRLGLLVETQATNTAQYSEDFNNAYWTKSGLTTPLNNNGGSFYTSPENNATALLMEQTTAAGTHRLERAFSGTDRNFAIFVKKQNLTTGSGRAGRYVTLLLRGVSTDYVHATFDLDAGTKTAGATVVGTVFSGADAGIEAYANDWYRVWITATRASGTATCIVALATSGTPTLTSVGESYTGANATDGIYIWGAQSEARNAPPTSYIPVAATSTVTRQADLAYVEPGDVTNWGRPGSFVVEYYKPLQSSGGVVLAEDFGGGNPGRLGVEYSSGGPKIVYGTSGSGSGGTDTAGLNKIGWAWNGSGAATRSALNGAALDTSLPTSFDPTGTDGISLGGNIDFGTIPATVSGQPNVIIRKVQFWNSQLSAADLNTLTGPTSYNVEYLVVAGGGGGGGGGTGAGSGGGAGGYRTASGFTLTPGTSYTITVGAGGAGGAASNSGVAGNNSVFSTITSTGGGRGRQGVGSVVGLAGGDGGSGGGGGYGDLGGGAAGAGTSGQGSNGGSPTSGSGFRGAGGGGASAAGAGGVPPDGGAGTASSISGSSVTYAGGGGGGSAGSAGSGGAGGGGAGGSGNSVAGTAGTANRGGGGGGGSDKSCAGGSGGSGLVVLRMPTANYSGVHTPATVTTSGSDTILTFTSSGTYTA